MRKSQLLSMLMALLMVSVFMCSGIAEGETESGTEETTMVHRFPESLVQIPTAYFSPASRQGELRNLYYDTYESMTYGEKSQTLKKRAVIYLPYGYSEEAEYPVFYLMHGGWNDETCYLGTPDEPHELKNVLDNAIADGTIAPMIIVCPTYNNTSSEDSGDYSLALRLTANYHNELRNDLIPAVEKAFSVVADRDHRAFCGFSMGSVATWRTFQYCLDEFRYFFPSSGNLTTDGAYMASMVQSAGYQWNDFFIFAASGTNDFAYAAFRAQIETMAAVDDGAFRWADNEIEGNLYFLEQDGGTHSGEYALEYIYNSLCWVWNE